MQEKVTCIRWRRLRPMFPTYTCCRLLHGEERKVWGDGGYQGQTKAIRQGAPKAQDMNCKRTRFAVHTLR